MFFQHENSADNNKQLLKMNKLHTQEFPIRTLIVDCHSWLFCISGILTLHIMAHVNNMT